VTTATRVRSRRRPACSTPSRPGPAVPVGECPTPAAVRCPDCGHLVLLTPDGRRLELEPHPLAVHLPEGGRLHWRAAVDAATGRGPLLGHHVHSTSAGYGCTPAALQLPLWES
jgi:hypothetical protein